jgi:hypothetical protein
LEVELASPVVRVFAGMGIAFITGFAISIVNGRNATQSLSGSLLLTLIVGALIPVLEWAADRTERKGYGPWIGPAFVFILNGLGILIVLFLPVKQNIDSQSEIAKHIPKP